MAATISDLTDDYLFQARQRTAVLSDQKAWLWDLYQALASDDKSEVTATSFESQSTSLQHRGASPEDRQMALKAAIEELESEIAGEVTKSLSRPFGFRFASGCSPAQVLDA